MGLFKRKNKKIEENIETNNYIEEDSMKAELNEFLDDDFDVSSAFGNGDSNSFINLKDNNSILDSPLEINDNFSFFDNDNKKEEVIPKESKKISNMDILRQLKPNNIKNETSITPNIIPNVVENTDEIKPSINIEPIRNEKPLQQEKPSFIQEKTLSKSKNSILKSSKSLNLDRESIFKKMNEKNYQELQAVEEKKKTCEFIAIDENYVFPNQKINVIEKEEKQEEILSIDDDIVEDDSIIDATIPIDKAKDILPGEVPQEQTTDKVILQEENKIVKEDNKPSILSLFNQNQKDSEDLLGSFFATKENKSSSLFSLFDNDEEKTNNAVSLLDTFEESLQEEGSIKEPIQEEIAYEEVLIKEPIQEEIVHEEILIEEPIQEEIVHEEVLIEEPIQEEIAYEEVLIEEPIQEEIAYEEVLVEEPIQEEIVHEEVLIEEPIQEEIAYEEVLVEEPIQEEIVHEEVLVEEPIQEEIAYEEILIEEPIQEEIVYEEVLVEEPIQEFSLLNNNFNEIEEVIDSVVEEVLDNVGIEDLKLSEIVEPDEPIEEFIENTNVNEIDDKTSSLIDNIVSDINEDNILSAADAVNKEKYNYLKAKRKSLLKTTSLLGNKTIENKSNVEETQEVVQEENHLHKFIAIDEEFDSSIFKEKEEDYSSLNNKFNPYLNLSKEEMERKKEELRLQREKGVISNDNNLDDEILKDDEIVEYIEDAPLMIEDKSVINNNEKENLDVIPLNRLDDKEEIYTTKEYSRFNEQTKTIDKSDIYKKKFKTIENIIKEIDFEVVVDYANFIDSYRKLRRDYLKKKKIEAEKRKREAIKKMQEMEEAKKARAMVEKEDLMNQQFRDTYSKTKSTLIGDISENNHDRLVRLRVQAANREPRNEDDLVFGKYRYKDSELSLSELNNMLPKRALYDEYVFDDFIEEDFEENLSPNKNTFSNGNIRPPKG